MLKTIIILLAAIISVSFPYEIIVKSPPECPPEGEEHFPDPTSCRHYYVCSNGNPSRFQCPGVLYWNQPIRQCDFPENVDCSIDGTSTTNDPQTTTTLIISTVASSTPISTIETTKPPVPTTTIAQPTTELSGPYCDPEIPIYTIPFVGNCSKYYLCIYGVALEQECHSGLIFNPAVGACVVENSYECPWNPTTGPPVPTVTEVPSTSITSTTRPTTTTTRRTTTTTDPTNPYPCPNDAFIYIPHPQNCSLFYLCTNGDFRGIFHCGEELWFHSILQGCVCPEDSDCAAVAVNNNLYVSLASFHTSRKYEKEVCDLLMLNRSKPETNVVQFHDVKL